MSERVARRLRIQAGAARGIRIVPENPPPEFRPVTFACDVRPARCEDCHMACPFTDAGGRRGWKGIA